VFGISTWTFEELSPLALFITLTNERYFGTHFNWAVKVWKAMKEPSRWKIAMGAASGLAMVAGIFWLLSLDLPPWIERIIGVLWYGFVAFWVGIFVWALWKAIDV